MHRRWVGSLLSLLLPGAGIFLAGDRRAGLTWFISLTALWLAEDVLSSLPVIPGLLIFWSLSVGGLALLCWLLVRSYRTVPKLGFRGGLGFLSLVVVVQASEFGLSRLFVRPFSMPTGSMEQTILRADHILVQTCAYWFSKPQRGDVVVFKTDSMDAPALPNGQFYVKRIAALPGEHVEIRSGKLFVDGKAINGPSALTRKDFTTPGGGLFPSETNSLSVASDAFIVVGDNPTNSFDSRHFGPVPLKAIYGKVTKIFWPLDRIGDIR